jgi:outer membrane protein assembly factor BamB
MQSGVLLVALLAAVASAEDWPQFRGPDGQGHSSQKGLPLSWSETENIAWKVAVPGRGWSSPAIAGDQLWLTTATEVAGSTRPRARSLRALAYDPTSGRTLRDIEVFRLEDAGEQHAKNTYASPTPVLEEDRVYVHYGRLGTAALSTTGEILWKTRLDYNHLHGTGGSPVLFKDLLIVNCDGVDTQYVIALNKNTGAVAWKANRAEPGAMAFSTPLVIQTGEHAELISVGAFRTVAYDPQSGRELWWVGYGDGFSNVPRPVFAHGLVYVCSGFYRPELIAVRPGGRGDVTASGVAWRLGRAVPLTPSPIVAGDELYMVSDNGILTCVDARSGKIHYQERLGGSYSASPVFADGRMYFQSEDGDTVVIAPGPRFRKLSTNRVDGQTLASLAPYGSAFYLRSAANLYRIAAEAAKSSPSPLR